MSVNFDMRWSKIVITCKWLVAYFLITFHVTSCKKVTKYRHKVSIFVVYILQKYDPKQKIYRRYHRSLFLDHKIRGASIACYLQTVWNWTLRNLLFLKRHNIYIRLRYNQCICLEFEGTIEQTDMHTEQWRNHPIVEGGFLTKYRRKRPLKSSYSLTYVSHFKFWASWLFWRKPYEFYSNKQNPQLRTFPFPENGNKNMAGPRICDARVTILQFAFRLWSFTSKYITDKYTTVAKVKFVIGCKTRAQQPRDCLLGSQIDCQWNLARRYITKHTYKLNVQ